MRRIALAIAFVIGLVAPTLAQKAEIEAANAKWIELFNKGDFAGIASLYTEDATAFPPGAAMVKGREAIGAMWKGLAEQVTDPKLTTLDVKSLGPSAAREIGTFSLKPKARRRRKSSGNMSWCGKRSATTGSSQPISGTTASRAPAIFGAAADVRRRAEADIAGRAAVTEACLRLPRLRLRAGRAGQRG